MLDVDGQWQRKNPDAHETEAKSAGILKAKSVIPGRPAGLRGEACVPVSIPSRTARAVPQFRFHLLYLVEIRHGQFLPRNLAPAHGTEVQEETTRMCQLRDYSFVKPCQATVHRRPAGLSLGRAVLCARRDYCRTQGIVTWLREYEGLAAKHHPS